MAKTKVEARAKRKASIRKGMAGSPERPRMSVFRSARHIYVQVIDDRTGKTLAAASTLEEAIKAQLKGLKKRDQAKLVGQAVAKKCLEKGVDKVVFDRNGFRYHGRVVSLANAAREAGLKF